MEQSRELVRRESELEKEIGNLRKRILSKEKEIEDTITDVASLQVHMGDFHENEYWPKVGVFEAHLEDLRESLTGGSVKPRKERPKARGKKSPQAESGGRTAQKAPASEELKKIYRQLAKLYHPDAAPNVKDKEFYQTRMAAINRAFAEGDIRALRRYLEGSKAEIGGDEHSEMSRLRDLQIDEHVLAELHGIYAGRLADIKKTFTYNLMIQVRKDGVEILNHMAEDFKGRIQLYKDLFKTSSVRLSSQFPRA